MVLNVRDDFRTRLQHNAYLIPFTGDLGYSVIRLISTRVIWKYRGAVHEVIESDPPTVAVPLNGVSITDFEDGSAQVEKWERDIGVLTKELEEDPKNPRTVFYLAQSYRDIGEFAKAAELYERRVGMGGWAEEMWYAMYQLGMMQQIVVPDRRVSVFTLLQAYQLRPSRLEPILPIVQFYNEHQQHHLEYLFAKVWTETRCPDDILFVERPVYEYLLPFEYAMACFYTGRADEARRVAEILERAGKIPADMLATLKLIQR